MKSINKKLYAVILACLLLLSFSIVAIAEEGTPSNSGNNSSTSNTTSAPADTSDTNGSNSTGSGDTSNTTPSDVYSSDTEISSTGNGTESYDVSSLADNSSNTNTSKISTSSKSSSSKKQTYSSKKQTTTDNNNDYQRPSGYGNVGGTVDDGIDTSGWGTEDASSELQSAGTTEKTGSKQITDYSTLLWILIWIPILLIIASVAALVYVNRKEFLNGEKEDLSDNGDKTSSKKKTKRKTVSKSKASHKKRTNVYKPRD